MPEGLPSSVQLLDAIPLGSSAFLLRWRKPLQPNGRLTGYRIYYEEIVSKDVQSKLERKPHINDPKENIAKLAGLKPNTKYRIHIVATTKDSEGEDYFIEERTGSRRVIKPGVPDFFWEPYPSDNGLLRAKINWIQSFEGNAGSHFFTKYRIKGQTTWVKQHDVKEEVFDIITDLEPNKSYEFMVVSVDGEYRTESQIQEILIGNSVYSN